MRRQAGAKAGCRGVDRSTEYRSHTESSYYSYRARYYNPQLQRFISEDPLGFVGGINFYSYADNNPANLKDPLGLSGCDQSCQNQIAVLQDLFPGSTYNKDTETLTIPQSTDTVDRTLVD